MDRPSIIPPPIADWELVLERDAIADLQGAIVERLLWFDREHDERTHDPHVLSLILGLADILPTTVGDQGARLLLAHDALVGRRGSAVADAIHQIAGDVRKLLPTTTKSAVERANEHALQHRVKHLRRQGRRSA